MATNSDPFASRPVQLPPGHRDHWISSDGRIVASNEPAFDPRQGGTAEWRRMDRYQATSPQQVVAPPSEHARRSPRGRSEFDLTRTAFDAGRRRPGIVASAPDVASTPLRLLRTAGCASPRMDPRFGQDQGGCSIPKALYDEHTYRKVDPMAIDKCATCGGSGTCQNCGGSGKLETPEHPEGATCHGCGGNGSCKFCGGSGQRP